MEAWVTIDLDRASGLGGLDRIGQVSPLPSIPDESYYRVSGANRDELFDWCRRVRATVVYRRADGLVVRRNCFEYLNHAVEEVIEPLEWAGLTLASVSQRGDPLSDPARFIVEAEGGPFVAEDFVREIRRRLVEHATRGAAHIPPGHWLSRYIFRPDRLGPAARVV